MTNFSDSFLNDDRFYDAAKPYGKTVDGFEIVEGWCSVGSQFNLMPSFPIQVNSIKSIKSCFSY
jgi:hypothetical protein